MNLKRLLIMSLSVCLLLGGTVKQNETQAAEEYPAKTITCIIPVEPGGDADICTRPLMEKVSKILGKAVVVVNKAGGGQTIGYRELYQAKADGYTIGVGVGSLMTVKMQGFLPYDYHDFTILGQYWSSYPILVASKKTQKPFKTIQDLFSFAKKHPDEVMLATTAVGGFYWNTAMIIQDATGIKFNVIPQEGSAGFVATQVAGGHADAGISGPSAVRSQIDAGNILLLAVLGPTRFPGKYDNIPTLRELGYDVSQRTFGVMMGPPNMPKDRAEKLIKSIEIACKDPEYQNFIYSRYDTPMYLAPQQFVSTVDDERKVLQKALDKAGLLKKR